MTFGLILDKNGKLLNPLENLEGTSITYDRHERISRIQGSNGYIKFRYKGRIKEIYAKYNAPGVKVTFQDEDLTNILRT